MLLIVAVQEDSCITNERERSWKQTRVRVAITYTQASTSPLLESLISPQVPYGRVFIVLCQRSQDRPRVT